MDYQMPPAVLPADAPAIAIVAPADVAPWRRRWTGFLFGGDFPAERPPLNLQTGPTDTAGDLERVRLTYDTEPGLPVTAYRLRRRDLAGPRPGVVVLHQTTSSTIDESGALDPAADLHIGAQLAARGFVVLCPPCFIFGDTRQPAADWGARYRDEVDRVRQRHPGWKGMAKMVWDGLRAVDALAAQPGVDPARLGCIGHSLGGKEALYLAAFDERIRASVSSDGGIGLAFSNWSDVWYLGPEVRAPGTGLENHQVLALIAPRAFLLVGGEYDNDRAWPFIASVLPLWRTLGVPDRVGWFRHSDGHRWSPAAQAAGLEFGTSRAARAPSLAQSHGLGPSSRTRNRRPPSEEKGRSIGCIRPTLS